MRKFLIVAYFFILPLLLFSQQRTSKETNKEYFDDYHAFQFLFIDGEPNLKEVSNRKLALDFAKSTSYYDISNRTKEITYLYANCFSIKPLDTTLLIEAIRLKALLSFQQKKYTASITEFKSYFNWYSQFYHSEIYPSFEYSKYAQCYKNTNDYQQFIHILNAGINKTKATKEHQEDYIRYLLVASKYFTNIRSLDTARYILSLAEITHNNIENNDKSIESDLYKQWGLLELFNVNIELALIHFDKAIDAILQTDHTNIQMANLFNNKAMAYYLDYQLKKSKSYFSMALTIYQDELPRDHPVIININRYLGLIKYSLGNYPEAIYYFKQAIELDPSPKRFLSYRNLAEVYAKVDSIDQSLHYYKLGLKYCSQTLGENSYQTAVSYFVYGEFLIQKTTYKSQGEKYIGKAIKIYYYILPNKARELIEPLNILGTYYINNQQINRGLDSLQSALIQAIDGFNSRTIYDNPKTEKFIRESLFTNTLAWKAYGLYLKYLETKDIKDLKMSLSTYSHFIFAAKETRKYFEETESVILGSQLNYVFGQAIEIAYQLYDITKDGKYIEQIFEFIEGKKSYTLFSSLSILEKKKLLNIPQELLTKEKLLKYELSVLNEKIGIEKLADKKDSLLTFEKQAFTITLTLDSIQKVYREDYSGFYNLKYGFNELSLNEIEATINENQAFLNYSLSDSNLTYLCITNTGSHLYHQKIDSSFYKNISTTVKLLKKVNTDNSYVEFHEYINTSRYLYDKLIKPAENIIKEKDIIFIPDAELNYISFDALLTQDVNIERPDYSKLPYLIKLHKSNYANSMQIFFNMKNKLPKGDNHVYAFAPQYQNKLDTTQPKEYHYLRPLDYSAFEIKQIKNYLPSKLFFGKKATKNTFIETAKNANILHFAMHTTIDDNDPMYSKFLFTYDTTYKNGFLNTYELLNLELNAELAVLSGCSTGDGELQKGEGVMSLSSGFQYAGVPAIVMSLWEVNDRFGSLVIAKFYKNLAQGYTKNRALHQAKIDVLKQGNALYAHPFYWSGLTLLGENSEISFYSNQSPLTTIMIILVLIFSVLALIVFWRYRVRKNNS